MVSDYWFSKLDWLYGNELKMGILLSILCLFLIIMVYGVGVLVLKGLTVIGWLVLLGCPFFVVLYYSKNKGKFFKKVLDDMNEGTEILKEEHQKIVERVRGVNDLPDVIHVGINEGGGVVCKECVKKSDPEEKFMSSMVEGGGSCSCVDCGCSLN